MEHGGDVLSYEKYYKGKLIDYSSNINPLGPPKGLDTILDSSFTNLFAYPDIQYRKLKSSLSSYLKCQEENIVVGNGAMELIDNFIYLAKRVIVFLPSFLEYERRAQIHGKEIENIIKEDDLLILGNPNNPTGLRIDKEKLVQIYEITRKAKSYLILDEAFYEFSPEDYDSIEVFKDANYEKLGIIRAATKFFALPGIRLGYGCTSGEIAEEIGKIQLPWSINSYAEVAGSYIFRDTDYIRASKDYTEKERDHLQNHLFKLKKIKVFPTETNYILIKLLKFDEEFVFDFFLSRGIIIRKCSSFKGLDNTYIRVAIRSREENNKLLNIFMELEKE